MTQSSLTERTALDMAEGILSRSILTLGIEEEMHVVDLDTRALVPRAEEILSLLPQGNSSTELHRSVVETNTPSCQSLDQLHGHLRELRTSAVDIAARNNLGLVAAGSVPLVGRDTIPVTPTPRYLRMLDEYQVLVREQLICGTHVHVGIPGRDLAVAVTQRVAPWLPVLLALSVSSPFWWGEDTGYASFRSMVWQRWPTAGDSGGISTAADYDRLVADLISTGVIEDNKMIYFGVRPSEHVPTVELRVADSCPQVETVVLLAGLFRALVSREMTAHLAGEPPLRIAAPLLRAAMWRAARSGLEGDLVDLPAARPVPAGVAVKGLLDLLRPQLEAVGDWDTVVDLADRAVSLGSSAARQRAVLAHGGGLTDVVDLLVAQTRSDRS